MTDTSTTTTTDVQTHSVASPSPPAKLYSLLLKLRPLEYGTLMPFSGELVHAAWLDWIRGAAPDVSASLHDGNQRRMFTCSCLQFPLSSQRMRQAERENVHLPVEPVKTYTVRLTFLLGELFPLFYDSLMRFNMAGGGSGAKKPPFMQIGKRLFLLEEVIADKDHPSGWAGFTTFAGLVEQVRATNLLVEQPLKLEFAAITTFSRNSSKERGISNHFAILPLPQYVFPGLVKRWQELAPPELTHLVQRERIEAYIQEEGIIISDYDLRPHWVTFVKHRQRGFVGTCSYLLRGIDEPTTPESPILSGSPTTLARLPDGQESRKESLTVRQQMLLLAHLAFYTGIGAKTAMGMGQTRIVDQKV